MNNYTFYPPYPLHAFHLVVREAVDEVIHKVKAPEAMVVMAFLETMSIAAQSLYDVELPYGEVRPVSLNLLVIADSGERKTGVHNLVARPLYQADHKRVQAYKEACKQYDTDNAIWKATQKGLERALIKQKKNDGETDYIQEKLREHTEAAPVKPRLRRIIYQNVTERAFMNAMEGEGESIAMISDEGELITKGGGLHKPGMLNKAWDGASLLSMDRSDGITIQARNPRLTVSYMVQQQIHQDLLNRRGMTLRGSGMWARYLVAQPASTQGHRFVYSADHSLKALATFHKRMDELLQTWTDQVDIGSNQRMTLKFSEDAKNSWQSHANYVESMLAPNNYLHDIKDFASKMMEIISRVSAILHVVSRQSGDISVDTFERAKAIVEWHMHEFKRIFATPEIPQEVRDAQAIEKYLLDHCWSNGHLQIQKNYVLKTGPIRPVGRLDHALACLMRDKRIYLVDGAKRTKFIALNPYIYGFPNGSQNMSSSLGYVTA